MFEVLTTFQSSISRLYSDSISIEIITAYIDGLCKEMNILIHRFLAKLQEKDLGIIGVFSIAISKIDKEIKEYGI